jgi:hypothetical protein
VCVVVWPVIISARRPARANGQKFNACRPFQLHFDAYIVAGVYGLNATRISARHSRTHRRSRLPPSRTAVQLSETTNVRLDEQSVVFNPFGISGRSFHSACLTCLRPPRKRGLQGRLAHLLNYWLRFFVRLFAGSNRSLSKRTAKSSLDSAADFLSATTRSSLLWRKAQQEKQEKKEIFLGRVNYAKSHSYAACVLRELFFPEKFACGLLTGRLRLAVYGKTETD